MIKTTRKKYADKLKGLKQDLLHLNNLVKKNIEIIEAFVELKEGKKEKIKIEKAQEIDWSVRQLTNQIEGNCIELLLLQSPLAGDLRFILSILKIIRNYERVSRDTYHSIENLHMLFPTTEEYRVPIKKIYNSIDFMMDTLEMAFETDSTPDPQQLIDADTIIDKIYDEIFQTFDDKNCLEGMTIKQIVAVAQIARHLERVGDHICNIAERWYYSKTGENVIIK